MMPRRSEIGRDSAFVLGSKFLGLSVFVASRGVGPYRERGQPLLGLSLQLRSTVQHQA
jgi:hypothetical protein